MRYEFGADDSGRMKDVLVQHGVGTHAELLAMSAPVHLAYCLRHDFYFIQDYDRHCPERKFEWEKLEVLRLVMQRAEPGGLVVWLDSDTLIVGDEDFRAAIPEDADAAMTGTRACGLTPLSEPVLYWNAGVMVLRNNLAVKAWLAATRQSWHEGKEEGPPPHKDERALWKHRKMVRIAELAPKWNVWRNNAHVVRPEEAVVRAWHGEQTDSVLRRMAELRASRAVA